MSNTPNIDPDDNTQSFVPLTVGTTVAHYRIIEQIGAGGMGEVYLAEDTKLDRKVALKFLPQHLCQNADCRARFTREAQASAKLDHPNIVAVHEVGEFNGRPFFSMQHVEGQTLKEVIAGKTLPLDRIVEISIQVCEGLQAAHEKGITHRDIKPSNILIDSHGRARIVDFGLASVLGTEQLTKTGSTLGTIGYMSPEQVRGEKVDHRTDLFSLGVVLYELLTGQSPFKSETEAATLHAITTTKPELLARYRREIPPELQTIIDKALEKDVAIRCQHADEMAADLRRHLRQSGELPSHESAKKTGRHWILPAALCLFAAMIAGVAYWWPRQTPVTSALHRQITFSGNMQGPAISPDGKSVAYVVVDSSARERLCVQDLAGGEPVVLYEADMIDYCRWSPGGSEILFRESRRARSGHPKAHVIPRLGGATQDIPAFGYASWGSTDGQIIYAWMNLKKAYVFNRADGSEREIQLPDSLGLIMDFDWSRSRQALLALSQQDNGRWVMWLVDSSGHYVSYPLPDTAGVSSPRWAPAGDAVYYYRDHGQTRDLVKLRLTGHGLADVAGLSVLLSGVQSLGDFSVSSDGRRLLQARGFNYANLWSARIDQKRGLTEVTMNQLTQGTSTVSEPTISPNGELVAFVMGRKQQSNIFVMPTEGGQLRQLTFLNACTGCPAWSPDGKVVAFGSLAGDSPRVWRVAASGGAPRPFAKTIPSSDGDAFGIAWSPGRDILYQTVGNHNVHLLDPTTEEERPLVSNDSGYISCPAYSNDGRHVAFSWNRMDSTSGLWTASLSNATQAPVGTVAEFLRPLGWAGENDTIYVISAGLDKLTGVCFSPRIDLISVSTGQRREYATIPVIGQITDVSNLTSDGRLIVLSVTKTLSDVWLIENFDPEEDN